MARTLALSLLTALLPLLACETKQDAADANSAEADADAKQEQEQEQEPEPEPQADPAAELAAKIDALAVVPETLPKDVEAACTAMVEQLDAINQAKLSGDDLTKWKTGGKEGVLGPAKAMCLERGNIAEAACAAGAMEKGGVEIEPHIGDIMQACGEKAAAAGE